MKDKVQILLVEDSDIFAEGLELLLRKHPKVSKVDHVTNYEDTLDFLKNNAVDIIILDLNFETTEFKGETIAKKVRQQYGKKIKIIVLTQMARYDYYLKLYEQCKVDAYLDKRLSIKETYKALEAVISGQRYIDDNIQRMVDIGYFMHLPKRKKEILELLCGGLTQKMIAATLDISPKTVEGHIGWLFERFRVMSSTELVARYLIYKNRNRDDNIDGIGNKK